MKKKFSKAIALLLTIATLFSIAIPVYAQEPETTPNEPVTSVVENVYSYGSFMSIRMNGEQAYCVQSYKNTPKVGCVYKEDEYLLDNLEKAKQVFCAIYELTDNTLEGVDRDHFEGVCQSAFWNVINEKDYEELVVRVAGDAGVAKYKEILALAETIDLTKYDVEITYYSPVSEDVQVLCIPTVSKKVEPDTPDVPDTPVIPDEPEKGPDDKVVTEVDRDDLIIDLEGERAYCVERNEVMPDADMIYSPCDFNIPERLNKVAVAIEILRDTYYDNKNFETASQYAVWQCYESLNMVMYSGVIEGEEVAALVEEILTTADEIDMTAWVVEIKFYEKEDYQTIAVFDVVPMGVGPIEPEISSKTEIPTIIINGETYYCIEKDKLIPDENDVYVIDTEYDVPARLRQLAVVLSEKEYSHEAIVCAVWTITSEEHIIEELREMLNENSLADFDEIMALVDDVDVTKYDITVTVYKTDDECKQKLAQFDATLKTTSVSVSKEWDGEDANKPTSVEVQLYNNGVAYGDVVVLNADNEWSYTWNNLTIDGVWSVDELNVPENYIKSIAQNNNTFIITNTYVAPIEPEVPATTFLTVVKEWDDDNNTNRPTSIEVQLYKDGIAFGNKITLSADNNWSYTFEDLSADYEWSVDELNVPENYEKSISKDGNTFTITNTYVEPVIPEPETIALNINKHWEGDNDTIRPNEVKVQLYNDGVAFGDVIILNAENNWSYTWNDLDAEGKWTVDELEIPVNYIKSISQTENGFTIINTYIEPEEPDTPEVPDEPETPEDTDIPSSPQTGDNSNVTLYIVLMMVSLIGLIVLFATRKKIIE